MSDPYLVSPLTAERIPAAFPLVSVLQTGVTEDAWNSYAATLIGLAGSGVGPGIVTVQGEYGCIYGLSVYRVKPDLRRGRILEIENFAVVNPVGARHAGRVLLLALEKLARERGCHCMTVGLLNPGLRRRLRAPDDPTADFFKSAGFRGEPLRLRKCFETAP